MHLEKINDRNAYRYLLAGQVLLFFFLFICIALIPHFLFEKNEGGISNYGLYAKTVVPFTLSTVCGAGLALLGSRYMASSRLKNYLRVWAILALLSLISTYPYKVNHTFGNLHQIISILLYVYEIVFAGWLVLKIRKDLVNLVFWITQIINFALGILNRYGVIHILFLIEVWEGIAFAVILIRSYKISSSHLQK